MSTKRVKPFKRFLHAVKAGWEMYRTDRKFFSEKGRVPYRTFDEWI